MGTDTWGLQVSKRWSGHLRRGNTSAKVVLALAVVVRETVQSAPQSVAIAPMHRDLIRRAPATVGPVLLPERFPPSSESIRCGGDDASSGWSHGLSSSLKKWEPETPVISRPSPDDLKPLQLGGRLALSTNEGAEIGKRL